MTRVLTRDGYAQTKAKLARLEERLARLDARTDLSPLHRDEARESYLQMIRQYKREIKLHEAAEAAAGKAAE